MQAQRNGGSENQSRRFKWACQIVCSTTAFFLLPSSGSLLTGYYWLFQKVLYHHSHQQGIIRALSITGEKFGLFIVCSKGSTKRTVGCQWAVKSIDFSTITDILFLSWRYLLFLGKPPTLYALLHYERKEVDHEKNRNIQS